MIATLLVVALTLTGGSDSPTPYTVEQSGITLPAGEVLEDNGHINVRTESGTFNLHAESKCIERDDAECAGVRHEQAQFVGQSFIPWSAFGLVSPFCVEWVQWSGAPEHFGEGGQSPVCVGTPTPEPTPTETPSPEPTPAPEPTPTCNPDAENPECLPNEPPPICLDDEEVSNNVCVPPDEACPEEGGCEPPKPVAPVDDCDGTSKKVLACTGGEPWLAVLIGVTLAVLGATAAYFGRPRRQPQHRA